MFLADGEVYRGLNQSALEHWALLSQRDFFARFVAEGKIVRTERLPDPSLFTDESAHSWDAVLRHERIRFVSYPYEWSFGMLQDAAILHLELLLAALDEGMLLKDASSFNVQWRGTQPVFIDIPSFVAYEAGSSWVGYRQFCQLFLYPLFYTAYKGVPFHPWLRGSIGGIEPDDCRRLMSWRDLLRPGVFSHVYIHSRMQHRYGDTSRDMRNEIRAAGFQKELIQANVRGLLKIVRNLRWHARQSEWSDYDCDNTSYQAGELRCKEAFVRQATGSRHWNLVWDLGANTGRFSRLAAEQADYVVAMDRDCLAIERLYQQLKQEGNTKILPLVMDLADPSANRGWRGMERRALVDRGRPELVLCLALIHHLVISAHIPLADFMNWLAGLNAEVVLEFVTREDPQVQRLLRFREESFDDYDLPRFEQCAEELFQLVDREALPGGTRLLYHLRPK